MWPLRFVHPAVLLAAPVAVAAFVRWRRRLGGGCALAAVLCLAVAAARPQWATTERRVARLYLLDVSGSTYLDAAKALDAIRTSMGDLAARDRAGLVVFAAEPRVALPLTDVPLLPATLRLPPSMPRTDASDLASAIDAATRQFADGSFSRQIVLVTDGRATRGDALARAALAAGAGVQVHVLPAAPPRVADARVVRLRAPSHVRVGEPFQVVAELLATAPLEASVTLARRGRRDVEPRKVVFEPRVTRRLVLAERIGEAGTVAYVARLNAQDHCAENNAAEAVVRVEGPTRVLYLSGARERTLLELLEAAEGLQVVWSDPRHVAAVRRELAAADCAVVDDVPAQQLEPSLQAAVRDWVRDTGGGLVAVGGPHSYGPGGYRDSPLEEALPVRCERPGVALAVALDKSGSMAETVAGRAKISYAREAVLEALKQLREEDRFALLAFDAAVRTRLALAPVPSRERLETQLAAINPGGPTRLQAPLEEALRLVRDADADVRLVVLVSDGQDESLDVPAVKASYQSAGVALSVLMTGRETASAERLRALSDKGFVPVTELQRLPKKLVDELRRAVNERSVRTGNFATTVVEPVEATRGVTPGPVAGYIRTALKTPAAAKEWAAAKERDPLLARWQFGLGRAVAFTSTVGTAWDKALWGGQAATLWERAVRWAARPARTPGFEAEVTEEDERFLVTVRVEKGERFVNGLKLVGRLVPPAGAARDVEVPQTAPGEYQVAVPAPARGVYRLTVSEEGQGQRLSVAMAKNYAREWAAFGVDRSAVDDLARHGRGTVLAGLDALPGVTVRGAAGWTDVDWAFLAAALALFVLEVAISVLRSRRIHI